jgi:glycosyltransferase involved in cell wall biosynthesis
MRVGLDVHTLHGKYQGIRTYVAHLARELTATAGPEDDVTLLGCDIATARRYAVGDRWTSAPWWARSPWIRIPLEAPARTLARRIDVFHSQYICPPISFTREVVTIHDILFESHPEWFPRSFVRRNRRLYRMSARRAAIVVTDSECSKDDLVHYYAIPPERVVVVPLGVDHIAAEPPDEASAAAVSERLRLVGVPERFHLCVGRIDPRKNLGTLADAYRLLRARGESVPTLVLVGSRDFMAQEIIASLADAINDRWIIELGAVDDVTLDLLYRRAQAVVYPTLGEGFGLPVLEAMRVGATVLTSPHPAIREFADGCVLYADPTSVEALADGLSRVERLNGDATSIRRAAAQRAAKYTWRATASRLWELYREAGHS